MRSNGTDRHPSAVRMDRPPAGGAAAGGAGAATLKGARTWRSEVRGAKDHVAPAALQPVVRRLEEPGEILRF